MQIEIDSFEELRGWFERFVKVRDGSSVLLQRIPANVALVLIHQDPIKAERGTNNDG